MQLNPGSTNLITISPRFHLPATPPSHMSMTKASAAGNATGAGYLGGTGQNIRPVQSSGATAHLIAGGMHELWAQRRKKSASQPRRKTRTYCHTGFVYKSLRQGPPHAPPGIRRKNGDIHRRTPSVAKLDPSRVKMRTYSPADVVLITRAHMRPQKRAEKRGRGGKILLAL